MKRHSLNIVAIMAVSLTLIELSVVSTSAHHGWRSYDAPLDMQAKIIKTNWGNPHDRLTVIDGQGETWDILLAPATRNRRYGFGEDTVAAGQNIRLVGERHPERNEAKIHQIWSDGEMVYEYLYGNGNTITSFERLGKEPPKLD